MSQPGTISTTTAARYAGGQVAWWVVFAWVLYRRPRWARSWALAALVINVAVWVFYLTRPPAEMTITIDPVQ